MLSVATRYTAKDQAKAVKLTHKKNIIIPIHICHVFTRASRYIHNHVS